MLNTTNVQFCHLGYVPASSIVLSTENLPITNEIILAVALYMQEQNI